MKKKRTKLSPALGKKLGLLDELFCLFSAKSEPEKKLPKQETGEIFSCRQFLSAKFRFVQLEWKLKTKKSSKTRRARLRRFDNVVVVVNDDVRAAAA